MSVSVRGFVIHLGRATARKTTVETLIKAAPCPTEIFDAVDGAALDPKVLYADVVRRSHINPTYPFELSKGEVACYMSHRAIWQKMIDEDIEAALVLEDDAVIDPAIFAPAYDMALAHIAELGVIQFQTRPAPKEAEILLSEDGVHLLRPPIVMLRTTAALISKAAALRLLTASTKIDRPIDAFFQLTQVTSQPVAVVAPSGISEVSEAIGGTTIQAREKSLGERLSREVLRARYRWAVRRAALGGLAIPGLKSASYRIQALFIRVILALSKVLPLTLRSAFVGHITNAAVHLVPGLHRRAEDNLRRVFPTMEPDERRRIIGQVARNTGRTLTEILFNEDFARRAESLPIAGPGLATLRTAQETGKGAIIVSGHFGQWEAIRHALKAHGLETGAVYRPNNNPYYEPLFRKGIEAGGAPIIARGPAGNRQMLKHIRSGGFIALLMDQYTQDGTTLSFMGHPTVTSLSAAQLALRYDLPLVPVFCTRTRDGFEIIAEEPIPHTSAPEMMQAFNDRLATRVHATPGQWLWLHNRWKISPWNDPTPSHER